jgi:hypothetical protein
MEYHDIEIRHIAAEIKQDAEKGYQGQADEPKRPDEETSASILSYIHK